MCLSLTTHSFKGVPALENPDRRENSVLPPDNLRPAFAPVETIRRSCNFFGAYGLEYVCMHRTSDPTDSVDSRREFY